MRQLLRYWLSLTTAATGCPDVDLEVLSTGCTVVTCWSLFNMCDIPATGSLAFLVQVSSRRSRWEVEFEPVAAS
ncbi:hypothetical protein F511_40867 [Dorcoceras hygrometricum]|uniref:Uncharacterized protein n=1 Tax=Dorcoceras hygrometricum TaxID=472368 RepID=A0A2Z7CYE1_9LAMI|nr:hypothetical protein F511_40867 [Dorcoceras hygrometricum]